MGSVQLLGLAVSKSLVGEFGFTPVIVEAVNKQVDFTLCKRVIEKYMDLDLMPQFATLRLLSEVECDARIVIVGTLAFVPTHGS